MDKHSGRLYGVCSETWREEIHDHIPATFLSYSCASSLSLVCASSIETVDQYVCKREPRGKN